MGKLILESKENSFIVNGLEFQKGSLTVSHSADGISINGNYAALADITADGDVLGSMDDLKSFISENLFKSGGGSGGNGAVDSVTGNLVSGTSINPVVSIQGTKADIITFDENGNPDVKPIGIEQLTDVGSFPSFPNGVFAATAMNAQNKTGLLLFIEFSTDTPKAGTFPTYVSGGRLHVSNAIDDGQAVSLGQLKAVIPTPPGSGNYILMSMNGVPQWIPG